MGQISTALDASLASAKHPDESAAIVALTRKYARLLDQAAPNAKYRKALTLLAKVVEHYADTARMTLVDERALEDMATTITVALGEHSVASDLGPKFLQALTSLGLAGAVAVPAASGEVKTGDSAADELEALRAARRAREHGA